MTGPDGTHGHDPAGGVPDGDVPDGGVPEPGRPAFDPWLELPRADDVPDDHPVREMLSAVADDPDAPPSSVTVAAILAAGRAQNPDGAEADGAEPDGGGDPRVTDIDPETGRPRYVPPAYARSASGTAVPAKHPLPTPVWSGTATPAPVVPISVLQARRARQRRQLTAVLAAACVIGVAVVAVPFAVSRNDTSTNASAPAAAATAAAGDASAAERAPAAGQALSAAGPATTTLGQPGSPSAGESLGGGGDPTAPAPQSVAGSATGPAPGAAPNGAAEAPPSTSAVPDAGAGPGTCAALPPAVATALAGALPGGLYGDPQPLTTGCAADGVYAASIPNEQGQSPLTLTVNRAAEGACVTAGGADLGCVSIGAGQYVSTTADGGLVVYAYAGGLEVAIAQGLGETDGSTDPSAGSATVDELLQAAQAAADAAAATG